MELSRLAAGDANDRDPGQASELWSHNVSCEIRQRGLVAFVGSQAISRNWKDRKGQSFDVSNLGGGRKRRQ